MRLPFEEARALARSFGIASSGEWKRFGSGRIRGLKCPESLPSNPSVVYGGEWLGWGDWLGNDDVAQIRSEFRAKERELRKTEHDENRRLHDQLVMRLSSLLLGLRLPFDIIHSGTGEILYPAFFLRRSVTRSMVLKIAVNLHEVTCDDPISSTLSPKQLSGTVSVARDGVSIKDHISVVARWHGKEREKLQRSSVERRQALKPLAQVLAARRTALSETVSTTEERPT